MGNFCFHSWEMASFLIIKSPGDLAVDRAGRVGVVAQIDGQQGTLFKGACL